MSQFSRATAMFQATINTNLNLLAISYSGEVTLEELQEGRPKVEALLPQLQSGFCVFTDLSGLDSMDFACAAEIKKMMDEFRNQGVGKVIRVIPEPRKDIGFRVMSHFHYGDGVAILDCQTVAEAIERL